MFTLASGGYTLVLGGKRWGAELRGRFLLTGRGEEGLLEGVGIALRSEMRRKARISAGRRGGGLTAVLGVNDQVGNATRWREGGSTLPRFPFNLQRKEEICL